MTLHRPDRTLVARAELFASVLGIKSNLVGITEDHLMARLTVKH